MKLSVFNSIGQKVATLDVDGNNVKIASDEKRISELNGKEMDLRVRIKSKNTIGDAKKVVKPGEKDYFDAVVDTIELMGFGIRP